MGVPDHELELPAARSPHELDCAMEQPCGYCLGVICPRCDGIHEDGMPCEDVSDLPWGFP